MQLTDGTAQDTKKKNLKIKAILTASTLANRCCVVLVSDSSVAWELTNNKKTNSLKISVSPSQWSKKQQANRNIAFVEYLGVLKECR